MNPKVKVNGKITAREVRVIGANGKQLGIMNLTDAIALAQSQKADLVEIAATAKPPVCRLVDFGKFRSEHAHLGKKSKKGNSIIGSKKIPSEKKKTLPSSQRWSSE